MAFWYSLLSFGIFFTFWCVWTKKIWQLSQPWVKTLILKIFKVLMCLILRSLEYHIISWFFLQTLRRQGIDGPDFLCLNSSISRSISSESAKIDGCCSTGVYFFTAPRTLCFIASCNCHMDVVHFFTQLTYWGRFSDVKLQNGSRYIHVSSEKAYKQS
jgi:hypothetical protein